MREDHGVDCDAPKLSQLRWQQFLKIFDEKEDRVRIFISSNSSKFQ